MELCVKCKGRGFCGKPCKILSKFSIIGKPKVHFSGSSPPEIFVGRENYPEINTGILAPQEYEATEELSLPEIWHRENFSIDKIIESRGKMIYARFKSRVSDARKTSRLTSIMQEISLASKPVSTEFFLKRAPKMKISPSNHLPIIGNPAPLQSARLEENPKIEKKAEYLSRDTDAKAVIAVQELYKSGTITSNIIKMFSAGMLGQRLNRKLVPTRWSITAVDDSLSKNLLKRIRYYPEISDISVFTSEYIGNHYEFLLLPDKFSFEVIEAKMTGSVWNPSSPLYVAQDYEPFAGRKDYAEEVTGAYYSNRLALTEYLEKIKRQASCLVMRECRPEYYAPCGVGILREASRKAFQNPPERFSTIEEAFTRIQERLKLDVSVFRSKSWLLDNYGKQTRLARWF